MCCRPVAPEPLACSQQLSVIKLLVPRQLAGWLAGSSQDKGQREGGKRRPGLKQTTFVVGPAGQWIGRQASERASRRGGNLVVMLFSRRTGSSAARSQWVPRAFCSPPSPCLRCQATAFTQLKAIKAPQRLKRAAGPSS